MTNATLQPEVEAAVGRIRCGRIMAGAVLLEAALLVLAVPLLALTSNPFVAGGDGGSDGFTTFFVLITVACFGSGALFGAWVARPLRSRFVLHGAMTGIFATAIYLAICAIPPSTIGAVAAAYGPFWFSAANGLRIAGATVGAWHRGRRR